MHSASKNVQEAADGQKTRWKRKGTRLLSTGNFLPFAWWNLTLEISASHDTWHALYIMSFAKPRDIISMIRGFSGYV
jgi:hypothetical protein